jgi:hypothetical protein
MFALTTQLTHIDLRADSPRECTMDIIKKKLKVRRALNARREGTRVL